MPCFCQCKKGKKSQLLTFFVNTTAGASELSLGSCVYWHTLTCVLKVMPKKTWTRKKWRCIPLEPSSLFMSLFTCVLMCRRSLAHELFQEFHRLSTLLVCLTAESEIRPTRLLTWCQRQTEGYRNVTITDLTSSWKSGIALCALIHRFKPLLMYVLRIAGRVPANTPLCPHAHFFSLCTLSFGLYQ